MSETFVETSVVALYEALLQAWNGRDAAAMARLYSQRGSQVGFDGSVANGAEEIESQLAPIFADHPTAAFIGKVREVRSLDSNTAILRAVAGMVPPGKNKIVPDRNAIQTLVASRDSSGDWRVETFHNTPMFHNTPAAFDGRPEERMKLTEELQEMLPQKRTQDGHSRRC
jgi:uncharacterized protein (TIGR02246 family)